MTVKDPPIPQTHARRREEEIGKIDKHRNIHNFCSEAKSFPFGATNKKWKFSTEWKRRRWPIRRQCISTYYIFAPHPSSSFAVNNSNVRYENFPRRAQQTTHRRPENSPAFSITPIWNFSQFRNLLVFFTFAKKNKRSGIRCSVARLSCWFWMGDQRTNKQESTHKVYQSIEVSNKLTSAVNGGNGRHRLEESNYRIHCGSNIISVSWQDDLSIVRIVLTCWTKLWRRRRSTNNNMHSRKIDSNLIKLIDRFISILVGFTIRSDLIPWNVLGHCEHLKAISLATYPHLSSLIQMQHSKSDDWKWTWKTVAMFQFHMPLKPSPRLMCSSAQMSFDVRVILFFHFVASSYLCHFDPSSIRLFALIFNDECERHWNYVLLCVIPFVRLLHFIRFPCLWILFAV